MGSPKGQCTQFLHGSPSAVSDITCSTSLKDKFKGQGHRSRSPKFKRGKTLFLKDGSFNSITIWPVRIEQQPLLLSNRVLNFSGMAGFFEPRVMDIILNNRTVNLRGGAGNNIAMDRICEFLNAQFKGNKNYNSCLCP